MNNTGRKARGTNRAATIADIAQRVGVTKMTVSNVLTGRSRASKHAEAILRVARELDFKPNPHAQRLSLGGRSRTVDLVSLDFDSGVLAETIFQVQNHLVERGFEAPLTVCSELPDSRHFPLSLLRILCLEQPLAIIIINTNFADEEQAEIRELLEAYVGRGGHLCFLDERKSVALETTFDKVVFDEVGRSREIVRHLISLGHRDIAYVPHSESLVEAAHVDAFRDELEAHGLVLRAEWILPGGDYAIGGMRAAEKFLALRKRPTAVAMINDVSACAFIHALLRAGIRVPEDVSVTGTDNRPDAQACMVPLTTFSTPTTILSATTADFVCSRIDGSYSGSSRHSVLAGELIVRQSTAPPRTS